MKKTTLPLVLIMVLLVVQSCTKKEDVPIYFSTDTSEVPINSDDYARLGQLHNDAVEYIIENHRQTLLGLLAAGDTIAVLNLIQDISLQYIADYQISFNGMPLDTNSKRFSTEDLLRLRSGTLVNSNDTNYYHGFDSLVNNGTHTQYFTRIDEIQISSNIVQNPVVRLQIQLGAAIGKASGSYWYAKEQENEILSDKWQTLAFTDLAGGVDGLFWGSFLGPGGTVVVGVNAAIIASCSSYLMDNMWP